MGYICTRCGGTNVACEAIVNLNTGKIIDYFDGSFMHAICGDCENEVIISNVEAVKHEIDLRFHKFVEKTGKEPEYVECQIAWKETGDDERVTIKLSLSINDDDNDNVFYYCNGIGPVLRAASTTRGTCTSSLATRAATASTAVAGFGR